MTDPAVLAIDTSDGSAVALVGEVTRRAASPDPRAHAEHLAVLLASVLEGSPEPGAVAVGTGPAPFTGLRAGLVTAEAFAFARGIPVWGVPSLDAVARAALDDGGEIVTVVTDARRREIYAATYRAAGEDDVERLGDFYVGAPAGLPGAEGSRLVGAATTLYPEQLPGAEMAPDPAVLARIALSRVRAGREVPALPLYLRRPDARVPNGGHRATNP